MAGVFRRSAASLWRSCGRRLCAPQALVPVRGMASAKLFVGGLAFHTNEAAVRDAFAAHGRVLEARIIVDRATGISRGFAFVTMSTEEEAEVAFNAMDGQILNGRVVRVDYATSKPKEADMGPGYLPMEEWEALEKLGWLDDSPPPEAFGPTLTKISFGPKTLQGGYAYTVAPQVPPYVVDPALLNTLQRGNPVYPPGRVNARSNSVGPVSSRSSYDNIGFSYLRSNPRVVSSPTGFRSSLSFSNGILQTSSNNSTMPPGHSETGSPSGNVLSDTAANVRNAPGYAKDIGPPYPDGGYRFPVAECSSMPESNFPPLGHPECMPFDAGFEPKYAQSGFS